MNENYFSKLLILCKVLLLKSHSNTYVYLFCMQKGHRGIDLRGGVTLLEIQIYVSLFVCPPVILTRNEFTYYVP